MLAYVGFPENEVKLLKKAAEKLGVQDRCHYFPELGSVDDTHGLVDLGKIYVRLPSVIFLNLDAETQHWSQSLASIKDHEKLRGLPVVGLGRVENQHVIDLYEQGINSYIRKPETFEMMLRAAEISLTFWLDVALVPGKAIADNISPTDL